MDVTSEVMMMTEEGPLDFMVGPSSTVSTAIAVAATTPPSESNATKLDLDLPSFSFGEVDDDALSRLDAQSLMQDQVFVDDSGASTVEEKKVASDSTSSMTAAAVDKAAKKASDLTPKKKAKDKTKRSADSKKDAPKKKARRAAQGAYRKPLEGADRMHKIFLDASMDSSIKYFLPTDSTAINNVLRDSVVTSAAMTGRYLADFPTGSIYHINKNALHNQENMDVMTYATKEWRRRDARGSSVVSTESAQATLTQKVAADVLATTQPFLASQAATPPTFSASSSSSSSDSSISPAATSESQAAAEKHAAAFFTSYTMLRKERFPKLVRQLPTSVQESVERDALCPNLFRAREIVDRLLLTQFIDSQVDPTQVWIKLRRRHDASDWQRVWQFLVLANQPPTGMWLDLDHPADAVPDALVQHTPSGVADLQQCRLVDLSANAVTAAAETVSVHSVIISASRRSRTWMLSEPTDDASSLKTARAFFASWSALCSTSDSRSVFRYVSTRQLKAAAHSWFADAMIDGELIGQSPLRRSIQGAAQTSGSSRSSLDFYDHYGFHSKRESEAHNPMVVYHLFAFEQGGGTSASGASACVVSESVGCVLELPLKTLVTNGPLHQRESSDNHTFWEACLSDFQSRVLHRSSSVTVVLTTQGLFGDAELLDVFYSADILLELLSTAQHKNAPLLYSSNGTARVYTLMKALKALSLRSNLRLVIEVGSNDALDSKALRDHLCSLLRPSNAVLKGGCEVSIHLTLTTQSATDREDVTFKFCYSLEEEEEKAQQVVASQSMDLLKASDFPTASLFHKEKKQQQQQQQKQPANKPPRKAKLPPGSEEATVDRVHVTIIPDPLVIAERLFVIDANASCNAKAWETWGCRVPTHVFHQRVASESLFDMRVRASHLELALAMCKSVDREAEYLKTPSDNEKRQWAALFCAKQAYNKVAVANNAEKLVDTSDDVKLRDEIKTLQVGLKEDAVKMLDAVDRQVSCLPLDLTHEQTEEEKGASARCRTPLAMTWLADTKPATEEMVDEKSRVADPAFLGFRARYAPASVILRRTAEHKSSSASSSSLSDAADETTHYFAAALTERAHVLAEEFESCASVLPAAVEASVLVGVPSTDRGVWLLRDVLPDPLSTHYPYLIRVINLQRAYAGANKVMAARIAASVVDAAMRLRRLGFYVYEAPNDPRSMWRNAINGRIYFSDLSMGVSVAEMAAVIPEELLSRARLALELYLYAAVAHVFGAAAVPGQVADQSFFDPTSICRIARSLLSLVHPCSRSNAMFHYGDKLSENQFIKAWAVSSGELETLDAFGKWKQQQTSVVSTTTETKGEDKKQQQAAPAPRPAAVLDFDTQSACPLQATFDTVADCSYQTGFATGDSQRGTSLFSAYFRQRSHTETTATWDSDQSAALASFLLSALHRGYFATDGLSNPFDLFRGMGVSMLGQVTLERFMALTSLDDPVQTRVTERRLTQALLDRQASASPDWSRLFDTTDEALHHPPPPPPPPLEVNPIPSISKPNLGWYGCSGDGLFCPTAHVADAPSHAAVSPSVASRRISDIVRLASSLCANGLVRVAIAVLKTVMSSTYSFNTLLDALTSCDAVQHSRFQTSLHNEAEASQCLVNIQQVMCDHCVGECLSDEQKARSSSSSSSSAFSNHVALSSIPHEKDSIRNSPFESCNAERAFVHSFMTQYFGKSAAWAHHAAYASATAADFWNRFVCGTSVRRELLEVSALSVSWTSEDVIGFHVADYMARYDAVTGSKSADALFERVAASCFLYGDSLVAGEGKTTVPFFAPLLHFPPLKSVHRRSEDTEFRRRHQYVYAPIEETTAKARCDSIHDDLPRLLATPVLLSAKLAFVRIFLSWLRERTCSPSKVADDVNTCASYYALTYQLPPIETMAANWKRGPAPSVEQARQRLRKFIETEYSHCESPMREVCRPRAQYFCLLQAVAQVIKVPDEQLKALEASYHMIYRFPIDRAFFLAAESIEKSMHETSAVSLTSSSSSAASSATTTAAVARKQCTTKLGDFIEDCRSIKTRVISLVTSTARPSTDASHLLYAKMVAHLVFGTFTMQRLPTVAVVSPHGQDLVKDGEYVGFVSLYANEAARIKCAVGELATRDRPLITSLTHPFDVTDTYRDSSIPLPTANYALSCYRLGLDPEIQWVKCQAMTQQQHALPHDRIRQQLAAVNQHQHQQQQQQQQQQQPFFGPPQASLTWTD